MTLTKNKFMKSNQIKLAAIFLSLFALISCEQTEINNDDVSPPSTISSKDLNQLKTDYGLTKEFMAVDIEKIIVNNSTYNLDELNTNTLQLVKKELDESPNKIVLNEINALYLSKHDLNGEELYRLHEIYIDGPNTLSNASNKGLQRLSATLKLYEFHNYTGRSITWSITGGTKVGKTGLLKVDRLLFSTKSSASGGTAKSARIWTWNGDQAIYYRFKGYPFAEIGSLSNNKNIDKDKTYNFKVKGRRWDIFNTKRQFVGSFEFGTTYTRRLKR